MLVAQYFGGVVFLLSFRDAFESYFKFYLSRNEIDGSCVCCFM